MFLKSSARPAMGRRPAAGARWAGLALIGPALLTPVGLHASPPQPEAPCSPQSLPSPDCGLTPGATFDDQGRLWVVHAQNGLLFLSHSDDQGRSLSPARAINLGAEPILAAGETRPKIAIDGDGRIHVAWSMKTPGRYTSEVRYSRSLDGGHSFSAPRTINDDGLLAGHSFESLRIDTRGAVHLVWLDARDRIRAREQGSEHRGTSLYHAVSHDHGASFSVNQRLAPHSCECCRIATSGRDDGGIAVLWRHVFPGQIRDHALIEIDTQGRPGPLRRATSDAWRVEGCPHHGPALSAGREGDWHLAWFSGGGDHPGLWYGRLQAGAEQPGQRLALDLRPGSGRPQVLAQGEHLALAWLGFDGRHTQLQARQSSDGGHSWSPVQTLAQTRSEADHPQLLSDGERFHVSWQSAEHGWQLLTLPAIDAQHAGVRP